MRLLALVLVLLAPPLSAAELRVLCAGAARSSVVSLIEAFRRETGHTVAFETATAGQIDAKLRGGARPDVVVVTAVVVDGLERAGLLAAGSAAPLARARMGVAVAEGAPLPDISTVEAFRRTLLAARAVAFSDPAAGGTSGRYLVGMLERIGIRDEVMAKAVPVAGGYAAERVANGQADIAVHQVSEILPVKGVRLVGPLPEDIQLYTVYVAAIGADTPRAEAARAFVRLLAGPAGRRSFAERGLDAP